MKHQRFFPYLAIAALITAVVGMISWRVALSFGVDKEWASLLGNIGFGGLFASFTFGFLSLAFMSR
uniref:Uncharacterized protein n=1 Tax=Magnetococcus massalia (strain MO-1) TaxID=451514 RepID=A0A1S7LKS4_MAGMO|nr:Exported protein of unknown function [Candidatus Magnetococcus massalia]